MLFARAIVNTIHSVLDEGQKTKRARFVFKLTKTVDEGTAESTAPLLKLSNQETRQYVLERHSKRGREGPELNESTGSEQAPRPKETGDLPPVIAHMVENYLKIHPSKDDSDESKSQGRKQKRPSRKYYPSQVSHLPSLDYVYDIYHLERIPEQDAIDYDNLSPNVGFVRIVNQYLDLIPDEDEESGAEARSDDEDSNEENYYKNDYPEDEDDDRSVLYGVEGEEVAAEEEDLEEDRYDRTLERWGVLPSNLTEWEARQSSSTRDEEFSELFQRYERSGNVLYDINGASVDVDTTMDQLYISEDEQEAEEEDYDVPAKDADVSSNMAAEGDETYERNEFFKTDKDDPLAQHRDKIFGRLQNMLRNVDEGKNTKAK